jgi:hypothetical protein
VRKYGRFGCIGPEILVGFELRFFERATVIVLALLLLATLVGCLKFEMEKVASSSLAPIYSGHQLHNNVAL